MSKKKEPELPSHVEKVEWKEITYTCPVRGKVTQKVKVSKIKSKAPEIKDFIRTGDPMIDNFELDDITDQPLDDEDRGDYD